MQFYLIACFIQITLSIECNLKQNTLKLLTFPDPTYVEVVSKENLYFDTKTQSFEVSKVASGKYIDVLNILAHQCNFTFELHLLNSSSFGDIIQVNQSYKFTGAYKALLSNSSHFDGIWRAKSIKEERTRFVDFLEPFERSHLALAIKVDDNNEGLDWAMFGQIVEPNLWLIVLFTASTYAFLLSAQEMILNGKNVFSWKIFILTIPLALASNFGGGFFGKNNGRNESRRIGKLILLICTYIPSIVFWIYYRAFLTSGFTTEILHLPFSSLKELPSTDYVLITATKGNSQATRFLHPSNQIDQEIRDNNVRLNESFVGAKKGLKIMLETNSKAAYLDYERNIFRELNLLPKQTQCQIKLIWRSEITKRLSVAFRKDFQFTRLINQELRRISEFGLMNRIMDKNVESFFQCPTAKGGDQLGLEKMVTAFVFIIVSGFASLFILICEFCFKRSQ